MQFRFGGPSRGAPVGCGLFLALFGLLLLTDLGVWLIKGVGWLFLILGLILVVSGIYHWLKRSRRRE